MLNNKKYYVTKRDGRKQIFDEQKIINAIKKAGESTREFDESEAKRIADKVFVKLDLDKKKEPPTVESIQDIVENCLMEDYQKTAKAYILYRDQHRALREMVEHSHVKLVDQYIKKLDWQVKENSNMEFSLQGLNNYLASEISKVYWLNSIYPNEIRKPYVDGDIHIHDLGSISVYCVGWDLFDLLVQGFKGVSGKIESHPPKHFRTALGQIVNFMYTMQGEAAGAIAFSNFDTLLAPFIRYDKLSYKEVKQAMQEFIFNMNVPTRVGFQTPFSNITLDLTVSPNFKNSSVVIGGKVQKETYKEFQEEMNTFNKALFEVMHEGDASGRVFTFPIPTVNITNDFDWENKDLEGLWKITAKYGVPYFSNFVNSDMKPEDARSMCCRLRLDLNELSRRGGGLFGANALTGSVGVVTINLPRLGYTSSNVTEFKKKLRALMDISRESLEIKRKVLENLTDKNLYPYTKFYLRNIKALHGSYWKNHFSTIGIVGLNEAAENLLGVNVGTEKGKQFAEEILTYMREVLISYQEETGNLYNLEATPAEGTSYRLAKKDKELFPDIKTANESGEPYYTNSSQLPVSYTNDIFESLDLQDTLQTMYTGGTVIHLFIGEEISNVKSVPNLVRKICENYKLPYFSITPTFSVCPECGYKAGRHDTCKTCDKECEVYSRIVGYLRPVQQWNNGKKNEFENRKTYKMHTTAIASKNKTKSS